MGFPKGNTPSLSDKEPVPQGTQESSQGSLHHSRCLKKSDSAKESHSHSKVHKSHKKSKHQKENTPKKEKWNKVDKYKSKKSCKK